MAIGVVAGLGALGTMTRTTTTNAGNGTFGKRPEIRRRRSSNPDAARGVLRWRVALRYLGRLDRENRRESLTKSMSNVSDWKMPRNGEHRAGNTKRLWTSRWAKSLIYLYLIGDTSDESTVLDSGCMHEGDARCPAFASPSALAGIEQCTTKYTDPGSGDVFYNRVFDGRIYIQLGQL